MTINKNCIIRLSRYKNALSRLKALGFVKVFSENLADATGVTSSQVRKDFSLFDITGNKKGGYLIDELVEKLNNILGKNEVKNVVVVGSGHIGAALMNYRGFEIEGIRIAAAFDSDPQKQNREGLIPVLPVEEMKDFIKSNKIKIGIISVPEAAAAQVLETMLGAGIKGILNFAPIRLRAPEEVVINNVNLVLELENVVYFVNAASKTRNRHDRSKDNGDR